jgi:hypothetical protein
MTLTSLATHPHGLRYHCDILEKLGTTEGTTISVSRETDGKIRITSQPWPEPKVILKGEVLEFRNVGGCLHIVRKERPRRM